MTTSLFDEQWTKIGKHASDFINLRARVFAEAGHKFIVVWFKPRFEGTMVETCVNGFTSEDGARAFASKHSTAWVTPIAKLEE